MSTNPHRDPLHYLWHNGGKYSDSELWFIVSTEDPKLVTELLMWQPATNTSLDPRVTTWLIGGFPEFVAGREDNSAFVSATLQSWWNDRWPSIHWAYDYKLENAPPRLRELLTELNLTTTEW